MNYTTHATTRMQQRGIGLKAIDALCTFGSEQADHHGANILFLGKRDLMKIQRVESASLYRLLCEKPIYAIEKNGVIITVGHRYKKILR